jgi:hypothetical protein
LESKALIEMKKLTEQMFEGLLAKVSRPLADQARAEFPGSADCYRMKDDLGHYFLIGFAPPRSFPEFASPYDDPVTAVLIEGADSISPGQIFVNVPLTQLVVCDCGEWQLPEGMEITDYEIEIPKGTWN